MTTTPHAARDHATWSASSTARNWACAGALALSEQVAHLDVESEAAAWGTACHQLSEKCLKSGTTLGGEKDAEEFIDTIEKTKRFSLTVDTEMANTAQVYVDYVRHRLAVYEAETREPAELYIEERFSLADLNPPFDAGGTGDAVIIFPKWETIEVVDLKGGRGVKVDVTQNKQLRTYALGAMLAHPRRPIAHVMSTVVQPRMGDGKPKSETYHVTELMEWTGELVAKMKLSGEALAAYKEIKGDLMREAWGDKYVVAGSHCTFCPAEGFCPAKQKKALAVAQAFFGDNGKVVIPNQPSELSPERLADALDGLDDLSSWANAVRALATRLAQTGTTIANPATGSEYVLVEKIGNRRFKGEFPAEGLKKLGVTDDELYTLAMRSPAQLEKKLGVKRIRELGGKDKLDALIHRPVTGVSLVSAAKTTRPAVASAAEKFFA